MNIHSCMVLHAPNIHTGGGFVLLRAFVAAWPTDMKFSALLDARAQGYVLLPDGAKVTWVNPTLVSRLGAELHLRAIAKSNDVILCFHGLPPLFVKQPRVVVFLQNRLYLARKLAPGYTLKTWFRLTSERFISRMFRRRVSQYIVQTPSMQRAVLRWYGERDPKKPMVRVLPFFEAFDAVSGPIVTRPEWDFLYVADGEAHKNHRKLIAAWRLLAQDGLRPSLALTLSSRDGALKREVVALADEENLRIKDLGQMRHDEVLCLYAQAGALIFPSTSESLGLPLIEAVHAGLPILAAELDYVRDVCDPVQTFDPTSPVSIARAVKRFLSVPEPVLQLRSPRDFWRELLSKASE